MKGHGGGDSADADLGTDGPDWDGICPSESRRYFRGGTLQRLT
jgi:hypothetical protein